MFFYRCFLVDIPHPYNNIGDGPEAPEAKTSADKLRLKILDKFISSISYDVRSKIIGQNNLICPSKIISVRSYGKKILIELDISVIIITSLGMTGKWQYVSGNHSHTKLEISDCDNRGIIKIFKPYCTLFFDDVRYMGSIDIIPMANYAFYFKDLGPDLLELSLKEETWISLDTWITIFTGKKHLKKTICEVIMQQELIAGIGNYLKSEILYYSGIHPQRIIETINRQEWDTIRKCAHQVIRLAYSYGGFTIESFLSPDGSLGMYPAAVYGKTYDPNGNLVTRLTTKDGRTSHVVLGLQK